MKKQSVKTICTALFALSVAGCLAGCQPSSPNDQAGGASPDASGSETPNAITHFETGEAEVHEPILPWEFDGQEEIENPYYKRTTDEDGNLVYAVKKASNNQTAYLPMGNTVIYTGSSDNCYYEKTTNTYKLDGEDQSVEQYQLYVSSMAHPDANAPSTESGADLTPSGGGEPDELPPVSTEIEKEPELPPEPNAEENTEIPAEGSVKENTETPAEENTENTTGASAGEE